LLLGYLGFYITTQTHFWLVSFWVALLVVALTFELIYYVERTHKDLSNFLLAIRQSDFSTISPALDKRSNKDLKNVLLEITRVFQRLRSEKETHHQYLQTVVEHIKVALLCFDETNEIKLMNEAAKNLFGKPYIRNIAALKYIEGDLLDTIQQLEAGNKSLIKLEMNGALLHLSIQASEFKLQNSRYKLVSFQDIRNELEAQEVESWQKLIQVLTHEIMNSVIPIATLTSVINQMLADEQGKGGNLTTLNEEDTADIRNSLQTIESRSKGLVTFVKAYSSLTQTAKPNFREVHVEELFNRVYRLLKSTVDKKGICFEIICTQPDFYIIADLELIEQVLINLVLNAIDAVAACKKPIISLSATRAADNQAILQVKDNGPGIDSEIIKNIFIPFYTTKKKGSGIGLSLSKQIMLLHKGNITVQSIAGEGSVFKLYF